MAYKTVFESRASYILYNLFSDKDGTVLLPANVCPVVPATLLKSGREIEFIDIDEATLCMDTEKCIDRILKSSKIAGIIYVRTYGYTESKTDTLFAKIKQVDPSIMIVDDRCLGIPEFTPGDSLADVHLYSSGYSKVAEIGFGGYAFLKDSITYSKVDLPYAEREHDRLQEIFNKAIQNKSKIDSVDFNWLDGTVPEISFEDYKRMVNEKLELSLTHKRKLNTIYSEILPKAICLKNEFQIWRFNIRVSNKEMILNKIFENKLFASSHYATVSTTFDDYHAPTSEKLSMEVINLFNDYRFNEQMAEEVSKIIIDHYRLN